MTKITITSQNGQIVAFEVTGHTGYGKHGQDIVCAAISTIVQTAEVGIVTYLGISANVTKHDDAGYMSLHLPKHLTAHQMQHAQTLLQTAKLALKELLGQYSKFLKMEERDETI